MSTSHAMLVLPATAALSSSECAQVFGLMDTHLRLQQPAGVLQLDNRQSGRQSRDVEDGRDPTQHGRQGERVRAEVERQPQGRRGGNAGGKLDQRAGVQQLKRVPEGNDLCRQAVLNLSQRLSASQSGKRWVRSGKQSANRQANGHCEARLTGSTPCAARRVSSAGRWRRQDRLRVMSAHSNAQSAP